MEVSHEEVKKMKKRFLMIVLMMVAMVTAGIGSAFAADKVFINGIDANYPPFSYIDETGKPDGMDVKAVEWIAKEMGFKVKHQPTDWAAIIPSLKAKKIDLIASGMSVTPERLQEVNFTQSYHKTVMMLVVKKDSDLTVDACKEGEMQWGIQRGTSEAQWVEENLIKKGKKFTLHHYDSAPLAMEDLVNGRIQCTVASEISAREAMDKGLPIKTIGRYGQPDDETAYAVRREDADLLKMLNEGLTKLMATPYWKELNEKYKVH